MVETKVWHVVIDWVSLWFLEGCGQFVSEFLLSFLNVIKGYLDGVVESEVWHKVVFWMALILLGWAA